MKNLAIKSILFTMLIIIAFAGCKKDKDKVATPTAPTNEPEVMTTFKFTFVDSTGLAPTIIAEYRDPDGDGGNLFVQFDTIKLQANKTYLTSVLILDETKNPIDTTSNEVQAEANDHLFFYTATGTNTTITILDYDTHSNPLPLGLHTKWKTTSASNGTTHVVLRHQPGIKDGSYAPGETDIDLTFQTKIE